MYPSAWVRSYSATEDSQVPVWASSQADPTYLARYLGTGRQRLPSKPQGRLSPTSLNWWPFYSSVCLVRVACCGWHDMQQLPTLKSCNSNKTASPLLSNTVISTFDPRAR